MLDLELHLLAQLLIQRPQGLVHQHQPGPEHQGAGQRHTLLLAARELVRPAVLETRELHNLQDRRHLRADLRLWQFADHERKGHVLEDVHVGKQRVILEDHAQIALMRRHPGQGLAGKMDLAAGGALEAGQHQKRRRLARPGRTEKRQELPLAHGEAQVLDHKRFAVEGLLDVVEADELLVVHGITPFLGANAPGRLRSGPANINLIPHRTLFD